jgi:rhodanese-related sulfurtransferase
MGIQEIDVDQLAEALAAGPVTLVDVREPDEYEMARVPGTIHIPLATIPDRAAEIPDGTVYIICAAGGRSMQACEFLSAQGRDTVNITGGTNGWVQSGRETASGSTNQ